VLFIICADPQTFSSNHYHATSPLAARHHRYTGSASNMQFNLQPAPSPSMQLGPTNYASPSFAGRQHAQQQFQSMGNNPSTTSHREFVPTPSEMSSNYNNLSHRLSPSTSTYQQIGTSYSTSRGETVAAIPERFVCHLCGKDFSRSHDRKRHYSTSHEVNGEKHICEYCKKTFSRYAKHSFQHQV
jgi:hypothetical protein